jgi:phosphoribosylaminoimidazolecarboxamide formyltransferase/IMP cyclohydrolase
LSIYPFEATVAKKDVTLAEAIENIDIGGVALLRAAAKNYESVIVIVDPSDYVTVGDLLKNNQPVSESLRKDLALKAFLHVTHYDAAISSYLGSTGSSGLPQLALREYHHHTTLKYGVNPHQSPAAIYRLGAKVPFTVLNGVPGYINLLDALNAYQLVKELSQATNLPAAASFKHVSPAGAAVAVPLTPDEELVYSLKDKKLTPQALAYLRARNADPLCSFGDFAALSHEVDEETALVLKTEVSDGIIAPAFTQQALDILRAKKGGAYIVLQADADYVPPAEEYREVYGVVFRQKRNDTLLTPQHFDRRLSRRTDLPSEAVRDLLVATITLKYTQSNSVGYALRGQMIGVGAGQQSRVDCAKLAGQKVSNWWMRFHPLVKDMAWKAGTKRQDKINATVHLLDNNWSQQDSDLLTAPPPVISTEDKKEWLSKLEGVSLSSDAFFPFRDSIDVAKNYGVSYVAHPGGSVQDEAVTKAADEYGMVVVHTGVRLFHH